MGDPCVQRDGSSCQEVQQPGVESHQLYQFEDELLGVMNIPLTWSPGGSGLSEGRWYDCVIDVKNFSLTSPTEQKILIMISCDLTLTFFFITNVFSEFSGRCQRFAL